MPARTARKTMKRPKLKLVKSPAPKPKVGGVKFATTLLERAYSIGDQEVSGRLPLLATLGISREQTHHVVDLGALPNEMVRGLLQCPMTSSQREAVCKCLGIDPKNQWDRPLDGPRAVGMAVQTLGPVGDPNVELAVNGKDYPVTLHGAVRDGFFGPIASLSVNLRVCDQTIQYSWYVSESWFRDDAGHPQAHTLRELLGRLGMRPTSPEAIARAHAGVAKAQRMSKNVGSLFDVGRPVLVVNPDLWWSKLEPCSLGTADKPRQVILEPELEVQVDHHADEDGWMTLPFLRAFSLDLKRYVYVDVGDLAEHSFDDTARERLVLPKAMRHVLDATFDIQGDKVYGDLFRNRHGGLVILANGPSGVGKTLTAEVFAEHTQRPLYCLEMGELGTTLDSVEKSLQKIFSRAARWNAVLLFDEADIFLTKRGDDLERSAIVGVFLRLLDRYEGMFFLTTNRADVIDDAFKSRITLKLDYPALSDASRERVWQLLLESAGITLTGDLGAIAKAHDINGRQIRNMVRILRILHPDGQVTGPDVEQALLYVCT